MGVSRWKIAGVVLTTVLSVLLPIRADEHEHKVSESAGQEAKPSVFGLCIASKDD